MLGGCLAAPGGPALEPTAVAPPPAVPSAPFGEARVVALAPGKFHPEGIALLGDEVFAGTAQGMSGSLVPASALGAPSRVFGFDLATGALRETILVQGEDTSQYYGLAGLKTDADGRLYAGAFGDAGSLGVLRFTRTAQGWAQETYAAIPDLPTCTLAPPPCSPTLRDRPALANDMTWDAQGNLYVTDSTQGSVWRVPPGPAPRTPELWYQHADLDRMYGANGIRIGPGGDRMFIGVCCPDSASVGPVDRSTRVVTVPFPEPGRGAPTAFVAFGNGEGADGLAFDAAGKLYVVSNFANKVHVVDSDGAVERTITNADLHGAQMYMPASLVFRPEARSVLLTNYDWPDALSAPDQRGVIEVAIDDLPFAEALPHVP